MESAPPRWSTVRMNGQEHLSPTATGGEPSLVDARTPSRIVGPGQNDRPTLATEFGAKSLSDFPVEARFGVSIVGLRAAGVAGLLESTRVNKPAGFSGELCVHAVVPRVDDNDSRVW